MQHAYYAIIIRTVLINNSNVPTQISEEFFYLQRKGGRGWFAVACDNHTQCFVGNLSDIIVGALPFETCLCKDKACASTREFSVSAVEPEQSWVNDMPLLQNGMTSMLP